MRAGTKLRSMPADRYELNKKSGNGTFTWPDGREYSGPWKNGKQEGMGQFKFRNGAVKVGVWENGRRVRWIQTLKEGDPKPGNPKKLTIETDDKEADSQ